MIAPAKGAMVASSVTVWADLVPAMVGGSLIAVASTVVALSLAVPPAVWVAAMVKVVVTDAPGVA